MRTERKNQSPGYNNRNGTERKQTQENTEEVRERDRKREKEMERVGRDLGFLQIVVGAGRYPLYTFPG